MTFSPEIKRPDAVMNMSFVARIDALEDHFLAFFKPNFDKVGEGDQYFKLFPPGELEDFVVDLSLDFAKLKEDPQDLEAFRLFMITTRDKIINFIASKPQDMNARAISLTTRDSINNWFDMMDSVYKDEIIRRHRAFPVKDERARHFLSLFLQKNTDFFDYVNNHFYEMFKAPGAEGSMEDKQKAEIIYRETSENQNTLFSTYFSLWGSAFVGDKNEVRKVVDVGKENSKLLERLNTIFYKKLPDEKGNSVPRENVNPENVKILLKSVGKFLQTYSSNYIGDNSSTRN